MEVDITVEILKKKYKRNSNLKIKIINISGNEIKIITLYKKCYHLGKK